jgi:PIN domain nuclease of toxin-antitoxin system
MILLDTVALIRLITAQKFRHTARRRVAEAEQDGNLFISAVSAWELCLLEKTGHSAALIDYDGAAFFRDAVGGGALQMLPLEADIAIESRRLPGDFHQDPADRFIIATARLHGLTIVTSDRPILDYAAAGHVEAIPC